MEGQNGGNEWGEERKIDKGLINNQKYSATSEQKMLDAEISSAGIVGCIKTEARSRP